MLLTTQYLEEADQLADRIAVIDHGRIIADGTARELKAGGRRPRTSSCALRDGAEERIATDGSVPDVRRILADIERRGVAVDTWEVRSPTLDDVFLTLTGRRAEPADPPPILADRLARVLMTTPHRAPHARLGGPRQRRSHLAVRAPVAAAARHDPVAVLLPVMLLLMFVYVFGGAHRRRQATTSTAWCPGSSCSRAGYGSANTAVDVASDMTGGIIDRFRSLPIRADRRAHRPRRRVAWRATPSRPRSSSASRSSSGSTRPRRRWTGWRALGLIALFVLALTWIAVAIGVVASGPGGARAGSRSSSCSSRTCPARSCRRSRCRRCSRPSPRTTRSRRSSDTLRGLLLGPPVGATWPAAVLWCLGIFVVGRVAAGLLFRRSR